MIPAAVHFVFGLRSDFGGMPWGLVHYLAVASAAGVHGVRPVIHVAHEPSGPWWDAARAHADVAFIPAPRTAGGIEIAHHAHRADLARLLVLKEYGGIYLDCDVLSLRPLTPLRAAPEGCVLGYEEGGLLCNGVVLAEAGHPFLGLWLEAFAGFRSRGRDAHYAELACQVPTRLAGERPDLVHRAPMASFHTPGWETGLPAFYEPPDRDYPDAYCHHLYASCAWDRWLAGLTPEAIRGGTSAFARLARPWLPGPLAR